MSNTTIWLGRILSGVTGLFVLSSGVNLTFVQSADLREGFARFGYPPEVIPWIGVAALISAGLYLVPRSSILGAVLLTGYLGGAVATHVRVKDPTFLAPLLIGVLVWAGLFLRDGRIRQILLLAPVGKPMV